MGTENDILREKEFAKVLVGSWKVSANQGCLFSFEISKQNNFIPSERYGLNYDTNLCNQLSQHSIRTFIPIRKHEINLGSLHLGIKG